MINTKRCQSWKNAYIYGSGLHLRAAKTFKAKVIGGCFGAKKKLQKLSHRPSTKYVAATQLSVLVCTFCVNTALCSSFLSYSPTLHKWLQPSCIWSIQGLGLVTPLIPFRLLATAYQRASLHFVPVPPLSPPPRLLLALNIKPSCHLLCYSCVIFIGLFDYVWQKSFAILPGC